MRTVLLLAALARADEVSGDPCDGKAEGDACTTSAGADGTCTDGACVADSAKSDDDTICGVVGTATVPLVLAALLPAVLRRRRGA